MQLKIKYLSGITDETPVGFYLTVDEETILQISYETRDRLYFDRRTNQRMACSFKDYYEDNE